MRSEMPKTVRNEKLFEKNNAHNLNCGQGHSGSDRVLFFGEDMLAILCGMQHCRPLVGWLSADAATCKKKTRLRTALQPPLD